MAEKIQGKKNMRTNRFSINHFSERVKKLSTRKLSRHQKKLLFVLTFLIRFSVLAIPLYLMQDLFDFSPLQTVVTNNAMLVLSAIGLDVRADGFDIILQNSIIINISPDCTGWKSMIAYFSLLMAVPNVKMKKRLLGLVGIPVIYIMNIFRISYLVWLGANYGIEALQSAHMFLWRIGFPVLILIAWLGWLLLTKNKLYMKKKSK